MRLCSRPSSLGPERPRKTLTSELELRTEITSRVLLDPWPPFYPLPSPLHSLIPQQSQCAHVDADALFLCAAARRAARPTPEKFAPDGRECQSEAKIRGIKSGGGKKFGGRATRGRKIHMWHSTLHCVTGNKKG